MAADVTIRPGADARPLAAVAWCSETTRKLAVALVFLLSFGITILPYLVLRPPVPFGSDMQHPQMLLKLLTEGTPLSLYPDYLNRQYPDTYGFLTAVFAKLQHLDPLSTLIVVTSLCMALSLAVTYVIARDFYGRRAALFALVAFGLLSLQPRQTYLDGTRIELISGLVLAPLGLLALHHAVTKQGWAWTAIAGIVFGALIRYHFLGTVQAALAAVIFILLLAARPDLIGRQLFVRLGAIVAIACALSLPYSLYYVEVVLRVALGRLGVISAAAEQEATFPAIQTADEIVVRLGALFLVLGLMAFGTVIVGRRSGRRIPSTDLLMLAWFAMLLIGTFSSALLVPERFLRNLAMPMAVLIGAMFAALAARRIVAAVIVTSAVVLGLSSVIVEMLRLSYATAYAADEDMPALNALHEISLRDPERVVLADDSGVWMPYFVGGNSRYVAGGPRGFLWFGEPLRSEMLQMWRAHHAPCLPESQRVFDEFKIGYVFVGRNPTNWTLPGYVYNDGSAYFSCDLFDVVFKKPTERGTIAIVSRRPAPKPPPAWAPQGITVENARSLQPPRPDDTALDDWPYRAWLAQSIRGSGDVLGMSPEQLEAIAVPAGDRSSSQMWIYGDALRRAAQAGVRGDPRFPGYHFQLWLQLGQPVDWSTASLPFDPAIDRAIAQPPAGAFTPALQWWYMANRARYNTVYYGIADPDPTIHADWARSHDDLALYNEITAMWAAAKDGVVGSPDRPRAAFDLWLAERLGALQRK